MHDHDVAKSETTGIDQRTWDPQDPEVLQDQRAAYDEMRTHCPVAHSEVMGWSLFDHADVTAVAGDPIAFSSATRRLAIPNGMDPPQHTDYRGALEPYFSAERLAAFEPRSRQIARDLIAAMRDRDQVEAIAEFVDPFAHQALCAFMGWPVEDWNRISGWTHGNLDAAFRKDREAGARLAREFAAYVTDILRERRAEGRSSDMMSDLTRLTVRGTPLDDEQIVGLLRTWTAGHGTVAAALGIVIRYLAEDVELQARLWLEPGLIEAAVWEILRTDGPLVSNTRTASQDAEIGGQLVRAGERISLMWMAANRDPAAFTDPEHVVVERRHHDNLLFGAGIHHCLGESLAILNVRVAVEEMLREVDRFELATPRALARAVYPSNGLKELPLRLRTAVPSRR
jgi:cytochrome P450